MKGRRQGSSARWRCSCCGLSRGSGRRLASSCPPGGAGLSSLPFQCHPGFSLDCGGQRRWGAGSACGPETPGEKPSLPSSELPWVGGDGFGVHIPEPSKALSPGGTCDSGA